MDEGEVLASVGQASIVDLAKDGGPPELGGESPNLYAKALGKEIAAKIPGADLMAATIADANSDHAENESNELKAAHKNVSEFARRINGGKQGLQKGEFVAGDEVPYLLSLGALLPIATENYKPLKIQIDQEKRKQQVDEIAAGSRFGDIRAEGRKANAEFQAGSQVASSSTEATNITNESTPDNSKLGFVTTLEPLIRGEKNFNELNDEQLAEVHRALTTVLSLTKNLSGEEGAKPTLTMEGAGLDIKIDQKKRQEDLDDVSDSDFFRNLKAKATELRNRQST